MRQACKSTLIHYVTARVRLSWKCNRTCGRSTGRGESVRVHLHTMSTQSGKVAACAGASQVSRVTQMAVNALRFGRLE